jgi:hypothetical protein
MRIFTTAAMAAIALVTGCASTTSTTSPTTSTPAQVSVGAPVAQAAPQAELHIAPTSAKRVVLNMTGPANVTQAKDWAAFKDEWRATFADHAKAAGIAFDVQQGDMPARGTDGTLLNVYVNDYRMVGIGARIFLGIMTGNAYIDAKVSFIDTNSGAPFGDRQYNTTSSAWQGVFGKMTPQQVDAIATQVFSEIRTR